MFFGLRWFVTRRPFRAWGWLVPIGVMMACQPFLAWQLKYALAFRLINLPVAACCLAAAWVLARQKEERFLIPARLTALLLTLDAVVIGFRMALTMKQNPPPIDMQWVQPPWMYSKLVLMLAGECLLILYAMFIVIEMHARVAQAAGVDALTGALNRRALLKNGSEEVQRSARLHRPLAAVCIDLDNFKWVNDTYGHPGGDAVLCAFADLMKDHLHSSNVVARTGGEEFVVLLPEMGLLKAVHVVERIRQAFEQMRTHYDGRMIVTTMSAGVAVLREEDSLASLLKRADAALYRAKAEGRNRVLAEENAPAA